MKNFTVITYNDIISLKNLYEAWEEFVRGKRYKKDVAEFSLSLSENIVLLHEDLKSGKYRHGAYLAFAINDPKPRNIHKAMVRDRLLHHAIHRILYPFFDRTFVADSYSCREGKGTHKAMNRFVFFARKVSRNNTRTVWVLKCDIKKFFASIDHTILKEILRQYIADIKILGLLNEIIGSFYSTESGKGLPLGNLTSQLLVNIYMNEFDQYVKHRMKEKYYVRYADDFVFLADNRKALL
jgi:retron-type reverse transcriptase